MNKSLISTIRDHLETDNTGNPRVRSRPTIRSIKRRNLIPYVLSLSTKICAIANINDILSLISNSPEAYKYLVEKKNEKESDFDYSTAQALVAQCLQIAVNKLPDDYVMPSLLSTGLLYNAHNAINQRRRQEDRWFAVGDLINYAPSGSMTRRLVSGDDKHRHQSSIAAFGILDGHHGPEVAEHCSHMAPYMLSSELQGSEELCRHRSGPDLLANVFRQLEESVIDGHESKLWTSGTTCTITLIDANLIYTAWVGDSQAWLVYSRDAVEAANKPASRRSSLPTPPKRPSVSGNLLFEQPDSITLAEMARKAEAEQQKQQQSNGKVKNGAKRLSSILKGKAGRKKSVGESPVDDDDYSEKIDQKYIDIMPDDSVVNVRQKRRVHHTIALTDRVHRPEFASEFVSVTRTGGMVSTEVETSNRVPRREMFVGHQAMQSNEFVNQRNKLRQVLSVPPLHHPCLGEVRVGGLSCVSRAIGDSHVTPGMCALPSITVFDANTYSEPPMCLILATDGLWDTPNCTGPDVAGLARQWHKDHPGVDGLTKSNFAQYLTDRAIENGSSDNTTCLVIWFTPDWKLGGKPSQTFDDTSYDITTTRWSALTRVASCDRFARKEDNQAQPRGNSNREQHPSPRSVSSESIDLFGRRRTKSRLSSPPRFFH